VPGEGKLRRGIAVLKKHLAVKPDAIDAHSICGSSIGARTTFRRTSSPPSNSAQLHVKAQDAEVALQDYQNIPSGGEVYGFEAVRRTQQLFRSLNPRLDIRFISDVALSRLLQLLVHQRVGRPRELVRPSARRIKAPELAVRPMLGEVLYSSNGTIVVCWPSSCGKAQAMSLRACDPPALEYSW